jgi:YesN/AraC family two-component response regulator
MWLHEAIEHDQTIILTAESIAERYRENLEIVNLAKKIIKDAQENARLINHARGKAP